MKCNPRFLFGLVLVTYCLSGVTVFGQSDTATLSGTVVDPNGAVVPGVEITVVNPATTVERKATSNDQGYFTVPSLPPGNYAVTARHDGFYVMKVPNIVLNVGDRKSLKIPLKVGEVNTTVTVTSEPPLIDYSPAVGTVVDRQFVANLPLNGRSFQSLIAVSPGVVVAKTGSLEQGQFSVNGQRADANYFIIDGVSANAGVTALNGIGQSGALPAPSATGGSNNLVSVDALQEFKIQTSTYAPEFGRTPGGQIQIITRSGTNDFRGTFFEYFRNDALDANNWFANASRLAKPALRQNDFGFVLGGPVLLPRFGEGGHQPGYDGRNRTFFFFSYEGLRLRLPQVATVDVPSLTSRQNAPTQIQPFLNAFPAPNGPDTVNGLARFSGSFSNPSSLNATSIRIDHSLRDNLTVFGRYNYAPSESSIRGGSNKSLNNVQPTQFTTQTITLGTTWALTPRITNDFRANYSRNKGSAFFILDSFGGALSPPDSALFPPLATSQDSLYQFLISDGTNSTYSVGKLADNLTRQINLVNNVSMIAGRHELKFGIDYRRLSPVASPQQYNQQVVFTNVVGPGGVASNGTALSGKASSATVRASATVALSFSNLSLFGQDTWRMTKRLMVTYGLRWEVNPPPSGQAGNEPFAATGIDNTATLAIATRGTPLWKTTYNNFAPRLGLAWLTN